MHRRTFLAGSTLAFVPLTGCLGFITGSEPLEFEATRATVSDEALDDTGYTENSVEADTITRTVSAAGQERDVRVTNWIAEYGRTLELGPAGEQDLGIFALVATPQVNVLGRTFNPIGDMSNREILQQLRSEYEGLDVGSRVGSRDMSVLGENVTVDKFEGTASLEGINVDLFVHITTVEHGDDFVVPIAVYPQRLPGEEDNAFRLLDGIQH